MNNRGAMQRLADRPACKTDGPPQKLASSDNAARKAKPMVGDTGLWYVLSLDQVGRTSKVKRQVQ